MCSQWVGVQEFIVEEGTTANTSLLVHTFAAADVSGGAVMECWWNKLSNL